MALKNDNIFFRNLEKTAPWFFAHPENQGSPDGKCPEISGFQDI